MNVGKRVSYAAVSLVAMMLVLVPAAARAPLLDEQRGVLTLAPVLEKVTPAVVSVAVASRLPGDENPLLRWRVGLRSGDIIVALNQQPLRSAADLENAVRKSNGVLALNIIRGDAQLLIVAQG